MKGKNYGKKNSS